jgi:hypothetical protein
MNGKRITATTGDVSNSGRFRIWFHVSVFRAWHTTHRVSRLEGSTILMLRNPADVDALCVPMVLTFNETGAVEDAVAAGEVGPEGFVGAAGAVAGVPAFFNFFSFIEPIPRASSCR